MAGNPQAWAFPDAFVGRATLNAYEPYPFMTGSAVSSNAPANQFAVIKWFQPAPLAVKNIVVQNSLAAGVPAATSAASAGSEGYSYQYNAWLLSRQDYSANSTNLSYMTSGSFGLTASMSYTSTSQLFGMSWVTDSTGGTSNFTTTSADAGWSNFASGFKAFNIPFGTTLTAGEYWMVMNHSSTSATSNSNVTLLSMSMLQNQGLFADGAFVSVAALGQSATALSNPGAANLFGDLSAAPTTSATMALTLTAGLNNQRANWFALSNA